MRLWALTLLLAAAVCSTLVAADRTCDELGFTGLALCSDCDSLALIVKDRELEADCRKCCAQEVDDETSKITYAGAVLEVCMNKIFLYPEVQSFVEHKLTAFPGVGAKYRYGATPKLVLQDEQGNDKEVIRIDNWKAEDIENFLKEKVRAKSAKD